MSYKYLSDLAITKTRKPHDCIWCPEDIKCGDPAHYLVGMNDGDFNSVYYHPECFKASNDFFSSSECGEDFSAHTFKRGTVEAR